MGNGSAVVRRPLSAVSVQQHDAWCHTSSSVYIIVTISPFVRSLLSGCHSWCFVANVWSTRGLGGFVAGWGQPHTSQILSSQSLAFKNIRVFKTVMERSLWWIGPHCRVCHLARVTLPSPSSFLFVRIVDDSRVHRGITGSWWSSICCTLWRICPPWPAVFQCLSHKISKTCQSLQFF